MFVRWTRCASYLGLVQAHIRRLPASNTIFFVILVIMVVINIITTIIIISNTIAVIVITTVVHLIVRAQILRAPVCIKYPLLSHHRYHHYHLLAPSYLAALFFINFSNIAAINITVHNHPNGLRRGADYRNVWGPIQYLDISCCQFKILNMSKWSSIYSACNLIEALCSVRSSL